MPEYNFLSNNDSEFPHIDNVNVYKYDNDFSYDRFDYTQMKLQICTVPWDMGEAHIGARTISGIGNVVYFESKAERDKWFDSIPDSDCYRFETKFKELHKDLLLDVPIPYDMCAKHNYLRVEYAKFANENSPVQYEGDNGLRSWFWFIREVEFLAPNTTRLVLMPDAFQTWIYDVNVSGMVLERGHAPMMATRADEYLQNPIENNANLLTEDVNFGDTMQTKHIDACVLNAGEMYACIATTADPFGDYGSRYAETWNVPARSYYENNGLPSVYVFATKAENINTILNNIDYRLPQFKQTIQALFFASKDLITLKESFTFTDVECFIIDSKRKTFDFVDLNKDLFAYPERYSDMAKLYTYPYACISITDENGNSDIVKIEDTNGKIELSAMLSLSYPFFTINTHLLGIGGNDHVTVEYKNIDANTFDISGNWFEYLHDWQIPTFAVVLGAATENDYATYFDRKQARIDYYAAWDNAYDASDTMLANASLQVAANNATTAASNTSAQSVAGYDQSYNTAKAARDNDQIGAGALSEIDATEMQGSISAGAAGVSGAAGMFSSALKADIMGAAGSAVNGIVGAATTLARTSVAVGLKSSQARQSQRNNTDQAELANTNTQNKADAQTSAASSITAAQNSLTSGSTANSAATQKGNADRSANAAADAITNGIKQAALRAPLTYGTFANGDTAAQKPIGLFAHIQTQSKAAISAAGDEFARYGYAYNKQWSFNGNWNIGKYFTYWKLRDFWVSNLNVPDLYMDRIRFFLFGGVTVWRKPEYIGNIDIYENF